MLQLNCMFVFPRYLLFRRCCNEANPNSCEHREPKKSPTQVFTDIGEPMVYMLIISSVIMINHFRDQYQTSAYKRSIHNPSWNIM